MKKSIRILLGGVFIAAIVSVFCVGAIDSKTENVDEEPIEASANVTYDIGKYGVSSPELYEWNADVIYPVARYKRTEARYAGHDAETIESLNGGWISWHVYCVSDGEEASEYSCFYSASNKKTYAYYHDTYGTNGYKNRLHIKGCYGSMSAGMRISNGKWCPDGEAITQPPKN